MRASMRPASWSFSNAAPSRSSGRKRSIASGLGYFRRASGPPGEARARATLRPLVAPVDAAAAMAGRPYEYIGAGDPLADEVDRASTDLEGLRLRDGLGIDVDAALARIDGSWIEGQVDAAIL